MFNCPVTFLGVFEFHMDLLLIIGQHTIVVLKIHCKLYNLSKVTKIEFSLATFKEKCTETNAQKS